MTPDRPSLLWRGTLAALERLPTALLGRCTGRLADLPIPRSLRGPVLRGFARLVGIDLEEVAFPLPGYRSINDFFVRSLRPGARTIPADPGLLLSPVDGVVGALGTVREGRILQAKGRDYGVGEFLEGEGRGTGAGRFEGGFFLTIYLSPRHYHRMHAPLSGRVRRARHLPGGFLPVNVPAVRHLPDLFVRNERLVLDIEGPEGALAFIAVAATNVGGISTRFDPSWGAREGNAPAIASSSPGAMPQPMEGGDPPRRRLAPEEEAVARAAPPPPLTSSRRTPRSRIYAPPLAIRAGEEIAAFHLGSTVVLLFEPGVLAALPALSPGEELRVGQAIARLTPGRPTGD